jgi:hypothetical protein
MNWSRARDVLKEIKTGGRYELSQMRAVGSMSRDSKVDSPVDPDILFRSVA